MNRAILIILASICISVFLLLNLSDSIEGMAKDLLGRETAHTVKRLDNFFEPVIDQVNTTANRGEGGFLTGLTLEQFNSYFWPFVSRSESVSSLMLAELNGQEKMFLQLDTVVLNRESNPATTDNALISEWKYSDGNLTLNRRYRENKGYDSRSRPWFKLAVEYFDSLRWTVPYTFFTTKDPGITVSRSFRTPSNDTMVIGYDVMLQDISKFTSGLDISENGQIFVITDDQRVLGLPHSKNFDTREKRRENVLKPASEISEPAIATALKGHKAIDAGSKTFPFRFNDEQWWGSLTDYSLGDVTLTIGVIAPESDFLAEIQRSRLLILSGLLLFIMFIILINIAYQKSRNANNKLKLQQKLLQKERDIANSHKQQVERKNSEIIDSINYAKKIQDAILPPESKLRATVPDSFVVFMPKDIVAGDFYWFDRIGDEVFFAAADCTGHGVPGAMLSLVCANKLQRVVKELDFYEPAEILNQVRDLIASTLGESDGVMNDGMDISFCRLNLKTKKLCYAGAHNSLYRITEKNGFEEAELRAENETHVLLEYKGDKQPIAMFDHGKPFSQKQIQLKEGDVIYISTDGFPDQFGGKDKRKMMHKRFRQLLLDTSSLPLDDQADILEKEFREWQGNEPQVDDVCIVGVRI